MLLITYLVDLQGKMDFGEAATEIFMIQAK